MHPSKPSYQEQREDYIAEEQSHDPSLQRQDLMRDFYNRMQKNLKLSSERIPEEAVRSAE